MRPVVSLCLTVMCCPVRLPPVFKTSAPINNKVHSVCYSLTKLSYLFVCLSYLISVYLSIYLRLSLSSFAVTSTHEAELKHLLTVQLRVGAEW